MSDTAPTAVCPLPQGCCPLPSCTGPSGPLPPGGVSLLLFLLALAQQRREVGSVGSDPVYDWSVAVLYHEAAEVEGQQ